MKKVVAIMSVILLSVLTGCGEKEELKPITYDSVDAIADENTDIVEGECPEGYVYDYQVSMEPIPEEIAALGGDVCGTIHAYPTEIKIALAKQEIEKDEELKKQNEKNLVLIKEYLNDTYGGKFVIEPLSDMSWEYKCFEVNTGKNFSIKISSVNEEIMVDTYFYEDDAEIYEEEIQRILDNNLQGDYAYGAFYESVDFIEVLDIYIAVFRENMPDLINEQRNIIEIYDAISNKQNENENNCTVRIVVAYFPEIYRDVIEKQYNSKFYKDYIYVYKERTDELISQGELFAQFTYSEIDAWDEPNNLDDIVENQEVFFEDEYVLPYWRKKE